jgi:DNA-binding transcriptional LysR family regulator
MDRFEDVSVFVEVAERGNFAEAARRLGRSPAAVTRAVADWSSGSAFGFSRAPRGR